MNARTFASLALLAGTGVGSLSAQSPAAAPGGERSVTRGFSLGVDLGASGIDSGIDGFRARTGGGVGVRLGYGVSDAVSLFARGTAAYGHAHYDAGARFSLGGAGSSLRPYVEGAVGYVGSSQPEVDPRGAAVTGGLGLEYFLSRRVALDGGLSYSTGRFTEGAGDGDDGFHSARVTIGVRVRP